MFILFFLFAQKLRYNNVLAISFIFIFEIKLQNIIQIWSYYEKIHNIGRD